MSRINNPLDLYKFLPRSNCRQCGVPSCMAFAAAVIKGDKRLGDCPHLDEDIVSRFGENIEVKGISIDQQQAIMLEQLKREIAFTDFSSAAKRLGAALSGGRLAVKCLGKPFYIDTGGNVTSECHINMWMMLPLLNYVVHCAGKDFLGEWVPFRELRKGRFYFLYDQRCEKSLKQLADNHGELFEDILYLMGGRPVEASFDADLAVVLYPLPKVPVLICYSRPEEELDSRISIFFDRSAEYNISTEALYFLVAGMATMFEKITARHG